MRLSRKFARFTHPSAKPRTRDPRRTRGSRYNSASMSFEAGTRLGPYEIIAPIGAGGMGEVYRARDTRLDRTVAVKVLPGALAADSESRQRFEQEARVIAALNDPHICTIHDVGRHGELDYLVLEFLEGETLEARLRRPPELQVDDALDIAIQMGTAVDRAHRAGIVHRDLKPGNVMLVRRAGASGPAHVKLLDFGVASRTGAARPTADASMTATISSTMLATELDAPSASGGVTGTIQYMAPEQFDGHAGDQRADIFAFGCVLYELLTGRKAFDGVNFLNVVAAIKSSEPPPNERIRGAHPMLDHVLRRCFEKDPDRRWQSIGDVTGELRWVRENPAAPPAPAVPPPAHRRRVPVVALLALGAAFGAVVFGPLRPRPQPASLPSLRFEIPTPPTDEPSVALSADGTQIAFVANRERTPMLWVRALDGTESRVLEGTEGASYPFWSPDGRTLGFFADDKLKRIDAAGGKPLVITDVANGRGGTWNAEGTILFASVAFGPIMRVSSRGGAAEPATDTGDTAGPNHRFPQFLPDGKRFIFASTLGAVETNGVFLASLDKTPPIRLVPTQGVGRFAPPSTLLAVGQGALQAYRFDPDAGKIEGEPTIVTQGFTSAASNSVFAVSNTGILAYRIGSAQRRQLVWVNRQGAPIRALGEPESDFIASPELSPGRAVGGRLSSAHGRQRHLDHRTGAEPGASHHRRRTGRRASSVGPRRSARRVLHTPLRHRRSGAAAGRRRPGVADVHDQRGWRGPFLDAESTVPADPAEQCRRRAPTSSPLPPTVSRRPLSLRSRRTKRPRGSSRQTGSGWRWSPTTAAVPRSSSSRSPAPRTAHRYRQRAGARCAGRRMAARSSTSRPAGG